jgi:hypothetical protein
MTDITCRHCGARVTVEREKVRVDGSNAFLHCPACRGEFPVRRSDAADRADEAVAGRDPIEEFDLVRIASRLSHR